MQQRFILTFRAVVLIKQPMNSPAHADSAPDTALEALCQFVDHELILANLGASDDRGHEMPRPIRRLMTVVELDAVVGSHVAETHYGKLIRIPKGIAPTRGMGQFRVGRFHGCSSLLKARQDLVRAYGLERFQALVEEKTLEMTTVQDILQDNGLSRLDVLKTDLEGMDFDIIRSCGPLLDQVLVLQAELRFQPYFEGEPHFHEVVAFLAGRGFELVGLKPEYWKYKTAHRDHQRKGRAVWADAVFFKSVEHVQPMPPAALARQIILAIALGHDNYAQMLLETHGHPLPPDVQAGLDALIRLRAVPVPQILNADFPHAAFE
jgi:hypothetical protein